MKNRVELNAGMLEQVNGGLSFKSLENGTEMMAELRGKAEGKVRLTDEEQKRLDLFEKVLI